MSSSIARKSIILVIIKFKKESCDLFIYFLSVNNRWLLIHVTSMHHVFSLLYLYTLYSLYILYCKRLYKLYMFYVKKKIYLFINDDLFIISKFLEFYLLIAINIKVKTRGKNKNIFDVQTSRFKHRCSFSRFIKTIDVEHFYIDISINNVLKILLITIVGWA